MKTYTPEEISQMYREDLNYLVSKLQHQNIFLESRVHSIYKELKNLRLTTFRQYADDEYFIWSTTEDNFVNSMVAPVIIDPKDLLRISRVGFNEVENEYYSPT